MLVINAAHTAYVHVVYVRRPIRARIHTYTYASPARLLFGPARFANLTSAEFPLELIFVKIEFRTYQLAYRTEL